MKTGRRFFVMLSALLLVGLMVGVAAAQTEKKLTVLTWNIPYFEDGFKKWVTDFNKIHPDVKIERMDKKGTEWSTFYQTQVVAGTAPDVIDIQGGLWLEYASKGGLLDITPYLKKDPDFVKRIYPEFLKQWVYEGKNYGSPLYISKTLLFYNKLMFKEAGLTEPPKNFDQIFEYARKMTKGEKSGFMTLNFDWLYWPLFAMNGVELLSPDFRKAAFNTPAGEKVVEALAKGTQEGIVNKISWTGRWVEPNGAFASGTVGMLQAHAPAFLWFTSQAKWVNETTVGAAHVPGGWSTPNSHAMLISKSTKYPDAAWDFVKISTSGEGAYALGVGTNNLTGDKAVNDQLFEYFKKNIPAAVPALKTQLEHLDKLCGNWAVAKDAEIKEAFYPELQSAFLGQKSAKAALADAEKKVNRVLEKR
jgi:ABC-type glycerol-3-phosphate transport system substrate-binding protein